MYPVVQEGRRWIVLASGERETPVWAAGDVDEEAAVFAAALAWAHGIPAETIEVALRSVSYR